MFERKVTLSLAGLILIAIMMFRSPEDTPFSNPDQQ